MERQWTVQKVEVTDARMRFYSPRARGVLSAVVMMLFAGAWAEATRRHFVPWWTLAFALLITGFVVWFSIDSCRKSPEGLLHFQVDPVGVHFGGLAFRPVVTAPYSALRRVLVGTRLGSAMAPVLFEFHSAAIEQYGLEYWSMVSQGLPVVIYSYQGVSRDAFETGLAYFARGQVPIVRFDAVDQLSQLPGLLQDS